jgi:amino acid transporter
MRSKLGFNATWSMAVGGMVGGGIFSTLGVVIGIAGSWAWLSFVAAGVIALLAGYAYARLAKHYGESGGAFTFLREINEEGLAGSLSWVLLIGYVLTNAVYAFTFGQYLGHVVGLDAWFPRLAAVAIVALFVVLNLRGVGEASGIEIFLVWFKLVVLVGLAGVGLARWAPDLLGRGVSEAGPFAAVFGGASVFMAYEGFQLLTYDYDDIEDPDRTLPRAILSAIVVVIGLYVVVALATPMLIGADEVVRNQEVALAVAGREAAGVIGLIIVTVAAAFSTGSAINSTLFATARLTHAVAAAGELPAWFDHRDRYRVPDRAVISLGTAAGLLAVIGSLDTLVSAASLAFLGTFTIVGWLAFSERAGNRLLTGVGMIGAGAATVALVIRLAVEDPIALVALVILVGVAVFGRPIILGHVSTE